MKMTRHENETFIHTTCAEYEHVLIKKSNTAAVTTQREGVRKRLQSALMQRRLVIRQRRDESSFKRTDVWLQSKLS